MPSTDEDKLARISQLVQHRCHPRAADLVHTLVNLKLGSFPERLQLLAACLASTPGQEPSAAYLVDPALQVIKLRRPRAAGAGSEAAPSAAGPK
jgi:hypothetical protein